MTTGALGVGRHRRLWLASLVVALVVPSLARAAALQIAIVADGDCPPALHDRIAEQLADIAERVSWSCLASFDAEDPFRAPAGAPVTLQIWVDVTPGLEARLMLRDLRADRFVVRRIPLPRGLDEIGREEIGQIVRAAALAVLAGPAETMNREQARAEISRWPRPRRRHSAAPPSKARPPRNQAKTPRGPTTGSSAGGRPRRVGASLRDLDPGRRGGWRLRDPRRAKLGRSGSTRLPGSRQKTMRARWACSWMPSRLGPASSRPSLCAPL